MSSALEMQSLAGEPKSNATLSPLAGKPAPKELRVDLARLEGEYFARRPDLGDRSQMVNDILLGVFMIGRMFWLSRKPFAITGTARAPTVLFI